MKNQEEKLMKIDLTLKITPRMVTDAQGNEKKTLVGHLGTHFDVMNKEFPLEYTERKGIVFDISETGILILLTLTLMKSLKICL